MFQGKKSSCAELSVYISYMQKVHHPTYMKGMKQALTAAKKT